MKEKLVGLLIAVLLLIIFFSGCSENKMDNTGEPKETVVIQQLIDSASSGDTIHIPIGTYYENIVIGKSITLIGENKDTTIIDGNETGSTITINADDVKISGFTIKNGRTAGIFFGSNHNEISNNIISHNQNGIYFNNSNSNNISDNIFLINDWTLHLDNSSENTISRNDIRKSSEIHGSIQLQNSNNNIISENIILNNSGFAISLLESSSGNIILNNNISNNNYGIMLDGWSCTNNNVSGNLISKNNYGITPTGTFGNLFYHNNLIENNKQLGGFTGNMFGYHNFWNGTLEGNYWSDYNGTDSNGDGIGDSPYDVTTPLIGAIIGQDYYPLMNPVKI